MPAVTTITVSDDIYVDGLLGNLKWATSTFTDSFPTDSSLYGTSYGYGESTTNFGALDNVQQATVRVALSMYGSVANLTFTEISDL
jgi:serralysin